MKFTSKISSTEKAVLESIIYTKGSKLYTRLYTKTTDRHMYMNFHSEHPMSLRRSIPYSQFLILKRIHTKHHYLLESQIHMYFFFIWREYPQETILRAWMKTNNVTREQLLSTIDNSQDEDIPLMFITTYCRASPNLKEHFPNISLI